MSFSIFFSILLPVLVVRSQYSNICILGIYSRLFGGCKCLLELIQNAALPRNRRGLSEWRVLFHVSCFNMLKSSLERRPTSSDWTKQLLANVNEIVNIILQWARQANKQQHKKSNEWSQLVSMVFKFSFLLSIWFSINMVSFKHSFVGFLFFYSRLVARQKKQSTIVIITTTVSIDIMNPFLFLYFHLFNISLCFPLFDANNAMLSFLVLLYYINY